MGAGKVGTLRINFVWGAVQQAAAAPYDWSHYDALIGAAAQQGIRVLPTVYSSPTWVAARPNYPPSHDHFGDFQAFVHAAAERYGGSGTFWAANPRIPKLPSSVGSCGTRSTRRPSGTPAESQHAALLRASAMGSRAPTRGEDRPGLFPTPRIRHGIRLDRYLPALYRAKSKSAFDAVAVHPYATTPKQALQAVRDTRRIMSRFLGQ